MRPLCRNGFLLKASALALASTALICCNPSPNAGGGIGGTGSVSSPSVSSGPVTKLNSVSVSGIEYGVSNALYCIDDQPCSTQNTLKVGMVVQVKGTAQSLPDGTVTRTAETVTFQQTVAGVVQFVAPDASSVVVLGQFVEVNPKTVIDETIPGGISNLRPGVDFIQVSGLVAGDGHILATFIMKSTGLADYAVEGIIKNHDAGAQRFEVGQLIVDYSSADVDGMTTSQTTTWNDRLVYVRGDEWQPVKAVPYGVILSATRVKPLGLTVDESSEAKLEGFITHVTDAGTVTINNHPIQLSADTVFENGKASELVLGAHVLIHGALTQGGLNAQVVSFKEDVQIESNVESIELQSGTLILAGFPGILIETDAQTIIEDTGSARRLEDLRIGVHLKVHGKLLDGQRVSARELELMDPSNAIVLYAPVQSAADPQILLANVRIDTSAIPDEEFIGSFGPIGRKTFFEKALIGRSAWGKGTLTGGVVTWSAVGIAE